MWDMSLMPIVAERARTRVRNGAAVGRWEIAAARLDARPGRARLGAGDDEDPKP